MFRPVKSIPMATGMKEKKEMVSGTAGANTFTMMVAIILETGLKGKWKATDS